MVRSDKTDPARRVSGLDEIPGVGLAARYSLVPSVPDSKTLPDIPQMTPELA
jgi:hypothetical protein